MKLGDIILNYRREHALSQRQFAAKCNGLTNGYISMIENGLNPNSNKPIVPSLPKLKLLANGMDITLDDLLSMMDDSSVDISSIENDTAINYQYSPAALRVARVYDSLPEQGKRALDAFCDYVEDRG